MTSYSIGFALTLVWGAILAGMWLGWQLLRQNGRVLLRLDELEKRLNELEFGEDKPQPGLRVGTDAPSFELADLAGERQSLRQFRGRRLLVIFFNPACGFCRELVPKLKESTETQTHKAEIGSADVPVPLIICTGETEVNRAVFAEHRVTCPILLQKEMEVAAAYQASGTPSGYLIDGEGKIASGLLLGGEALLEALHGKLENGKQKLENTVDGNDRENRFSNRFLVRSKIKRDGLKAGTPAPDFRLPRMDGRGELALSDLRGRRLLLVFSSPNCGPCLELAPKIEKFYRAHPQLEVLMVSKGEPKENRAKIKEYDLTFPVLVQQQWEVSRKYAMFATPVAYLIDEQGIIASDVAIGADAILVLLGKAGSHLENGEFSPDIRAVGDLASLSR